MKIFKNRKLVKFIILISLSFLLDSCNLNDNSIKGYLKISGRNIASVGENHLPKLDFISNQDVKTNEALAFDINDGGDDLDSDGQTLNYDCFYDLIQDNFVSDSDSCSNIYGISFNSQTGILNWVPKFNQAGSYEFKVVGNDGFSSDSRIFTVNVAPSENFESMSLGDYHGCGISSNKIYCMGFNSSGQLGDGTRSNRNLPTLVDSSSLGLSHFVSVSSGTDSTCGLTDAGEIYCWGNNSSGQLGTGGSLDSLTPTLVDMSSLNGHHFTSVSVGFKHTCGLVDDGSAFCWGWNVYGQVGNGSIGFSVTMPSKVDSSQLGTSTFLSIEAGHSNTCALSSDHIPFCWGRNAYGILGQGDGFTSPNSSIPIAVNISSIGNPTFSSLSAQGHHACGITTLGETYCWGFDGEGSVLHFGMLGNDIFDINLDVPTQIDSSALNGAHLLSISAHQKNSCGIGSDGFAYCWGYDLYGNLGNGLPNQNSGIPVIVDHTPLDGAKFINIFVGENHVCGITDDHRTFCWGTDIYGRLGNGGADEDSSVPVPIDISILNH